MWCMCGACVVPATYATSCQKELASKMRLNHHLAAARSLWQTLSKTLSKHHLSAARPLWRTRSKILSKHHLSAARWQCQTLSKILSKHHPSAARSQWQTLSKILSKHHLSEARSQWQTLSKLWWLSSVHEEPHAAHHPHDFKLAGLRRSGDRTRPQLAGCRETEGFDSSWLALFSWSAALLSFFRCAIFMLPIARWQDLLYRQSRSASRSVSFDVTHDMFPVSFFKRIGG